MKKYLIMSLILLLAGCSGTRVLHTETGDNADLTRYQRFDFFQVKASGDTVSALFTERINVLKEAITVEMERRGIITLLTILSCWLISASVSRKKCRQGRPTGVLMALPVISASVITAGKANR